MYCICSCLLMIENQAYQTNKQILIIDDLVTFYKDNPADTLISVLIYRSLNSSVEALFSML